MKSLFGIGGGLAISCVSFFPFAAYARPTFGDCAKQIERHGYAISEMDLRGSNYDFDATKGGRKWDIRADQNCKIVDKRLD